MPHIEAKTQVTNRPIEVLQGACFTTVHRYHRPGDPERHPGLILFCTRCGAVEVWAASDEDYWPEALGAASAHYLWGKDWDREQAYLGETGDGNANT